MNKPKLRLLLINGLEQMGKLPLASLVEKAGVSLFALHDSFLENVLIGKWTDKDGQEMRTAYREFITSFVNQKTMRSALGRDDIHKIAPSTHSLEECKQELDRLDKIKFERPAEIWFEYRRLAMRLIDYKPSKTDPYFQVVYPVGSFRYVDRLRTLVDELYVIDINRGFEGWMNSRVRRYQYVYIEGHHSVASLRAYQPRNFISAYQEYQDYLAKSPYLRVDFEDLVSGDLEKVFRRVVDYLALSPPKGIDLKKEKYDAQFFLADYQKMFTPFDDQQDFLGKLQRRYLKKMEKRQLTRWNDLICRALFVMQYWLNKKRLQRVNLT